MLAAAASTLAFPAIVKAQSERFAGITLRVNGYGGEWDRIMQEQIGQPLQRKTGLRVEFAPGAALQATAKVLASPNDPPFDILMIDSPIMPEILKAQVTTPVTTSEVKGISRVLPGVREFGDYGVPLCTSSLALLYNSSRVKTPLKSIADLATPELKGAVALVNLENNIGLLTLLVMAGANGGSVENIGPGLSALAKLKPNIATITSSTINIVQLFEQEEILAAPFTDARGYYFQKAGRPIVMVEPAEGSASTVTYLTPVKGTKHPEAVQEFLDEALNGNYLAAVADYFGLAPATDIQLPGDLANKLFKPKNRRPQDWTKVAANRSAWLRLFNKEFS